MKVPMIKDKDIRRVLGEEEGRNRDTEQEKQVGKKERKWEVSEEWWGTEEPLVRSEGSSE